MSFLARQMCSAKWKTVSDWLRIPAIVSRVPDASPRHTALKDGIVKIVRTFGDKLSAFKFPPRTARKLQGFVDYN